MAGLPTVFVRLTGCPLRCQYCDTEYAFTGGTRMTFEEILNEISTYNCHRICITGGEPLAQKACLDLMTYLCDQNYLLSIETSGAMDIEEVDSRVIKVMDLKTPASGEMIKNRLENLNFLNQHDQLKFVICNRRDYDWAKMQIEEHQLHNKCIILFSPSYGELEATELAEWILADQLEVRMQVQLHKLLWGEKQGV